MGNVIRREDKEALSLIAEFYGDVFSKLEEDNSIPKTKLYYSMLLHTLRYHNNIIIYMTENDDKGNIIGKGLSESIKDIITLVQFHSKYPQFFSNVSNSDELLYGFITPENLLDDMHRSNSTARAKLMRITRLLLLACDNNLRQSYEDLRKEEKNNKEKPSFIDTKVTLSDDKKYIKNDLLVCSKSSSIHFGEFYDSIVEEKGAFTKLSKLFDSLYEKVESNHLFNKNDLANIILMIDKFKEKKYGKLEEEGAWSKHLREYHDLRYDIQREHLIILFGLRDTIDKIKSKGEDTPTPLETNKKLSLKSLLFWKKKKTDNE